ncbi:extracellular solute-binding protein [Paenibacillus nasutitermitis]|uniref:Lipoprotein LipO n=1 Tax=Paenibacillus nasutitermitis TaxID=1652958 RepID=A0A917E2X2_9BACL|nr:extracellular solute-binding protein [Paenibacillus nasutitermitis]GGD94993.1 lipoprotein LipO [Paenibacillus nasutitermitis]
MTKRKVITALLASMLVITLLAGCGSNDSENGEASKSNTLKIMRTYHAGLEQFTGNDNINNNKLVNLLSEWSGLNLNYEPLPKDNVSQKISVLLASGDVPDILWIPGKSDYFKLAQQGAFEPLDDLIKQNIPNISSVFSQDELDVAKLDGVTYGIPIRIAQKVGNGLLVRTDILSELGLKAPTTLDEMYKTLKTIKEKKGIAPYTAATSNPGAFKSGFSPLAGAFGVGTSTVVKDGKLEFSWLQPEYKQFLETMKTWYDEGLIDKEFAINKDVKDKMINGTAAMTTTFWSDAMRIDQAIEEKGKSDTIHYIAPPIGQDGKSGIPAESLADTYLVIPKKAKNKIGAAEYYNFLLEDKTDKLITFGIENEDYTIENNEVVQTAEQSNQIPWRTLYFSLDTDKSFNSRLAAKGFLPYYNELLPFKQNREETAYSPFVEAWDTKFTELQNYMEENAMKFIMGKRDLSEFDKFVEEFNAKGGEAAIKAMNEWFVNQ